MRSCWGHATRLEDLRSQGLVVVVREEWRGEKRRLIGFSAPELREDERRGGWMEGGGQGDREDREGVHMCFLPSLFHFW